MTARKSKSNDKRPRAVIDHPRVARMKRLGTYELQKPGRYIVSTTQMADASENAKKVMQDEREGKYPEPKKATKKTKKVNKVIKVSKSKRSKK